MLFQFSRQARPSAVVATMLCAGFTGALVIGFTSEASAESGITFVHIDDDAPNDPGPLNPDLSDPLEDGTFEHPFDSLADIAASGLNVRSIFFNPGVYSGGLDLDVLYNCTHGLRLAGSDTDNPEIIDSTIIVFNDLEDTFRFDDNSCGEIPEITIAGLTFAGHDPSAERFAPGEMRPDAAIVIGEGTRLIMENCVFRELQGELAPALRKYSGSGDTGETTIRNCVFDRNIGRDVAAVWTSREDLAVNDCVFTDNERIDEDVSANSAANLIGGRDGTVYLSQTNAIIRDCTFLRNTSDDGTAGIKSDYVGNVLIENCDFRFNRGRNGGAVLVSDDKGFASIRSSYFEGNEATNRGGAVQHEGSPYFLSGSTFISPAVQDCIFINNSSGSGGAYRGQAFVSDCHFEGNMAGAGGAAVFDSPGRAERCTFIGNHADFSGGAILVDRSDLQVIDCELRGNTASESGGAVFVDDHQTVRMTACRVVGNTALYGGGVFQSESSSQDETERSVFENCVLHDNSAALGGAIQNNFRLALHNCTLFENTATVGGGIYHVGGFSDVANSIVYGNGDNPIVESEPSLSSVRNSNIEGGWIGKGHSNIDQQPMFIEAAADDFRLVPGSPGVDSGGNNLIPRQITQTSNSIETSCRRIPLDAAGQPRVQNDPLRPDTGCAIAPGEAIVDMGAYETRGAVSQLVAGDLNGDEIVDTFDLLTLIAEYQTTGICLTADVDGDEAVDVNDLLIMLASWGCDD